MFNAECVKCEDDQLKTTTKGTTWYPSVHYEKAKSQHVRDWDRAEDCDCEFPKCDKHSASAKVMSSYRDELVKYITETVTTVLSKPSRKSSKDHQPKESLTREEIAKKHRKRKEKRKTVIKERQKARKKKKERKTVKRGVKKPTKVETTVHVRKKMVYDEQEDD